MIKYKYSNSLKEERIEERKGLPKDLKKAYIQDEPKTTKKFIDDPNFITRKYPIEASKSSRARVLKGQKLINYSETDYTEVTPEEAVTYPKSKLRFLVKNIYDDSWYVMYYNDNGDMAVSSASLASREFSRAMEKKLGKPARKGKIRFNDALKVADKIYVTDESEHYYEAPEEYVKDRYNKKSKPSGNTRGSQDKHVSLWGIERGSSVWINKYRSDKAQRAIKLIQDLPPKKHGLDELIREYKSRVSDTGTILSVNTNISSESRGEERYGSKDYYDSQAIEYRSTIKAIGEWKSNIERAQHMILELNSRLVELQGKITEFDDIAKEKFNQPEYQKGLQNLLEDITELKSEYISLTDELNNEFPQFKEYIKRKL